MNFSDLDLEPARAPARGRAMRRFSGVAAAGFGLAALHAAIAALALASFFPFHGAIVATLKAWLAPFCAPAWPVTPTLPELAALASSGARHLLAAQPVSALAAIFMAVLVALFLGMTAAYAFGSTVPRRRATVLGVLAASMFAQTIALAGVFELMRALHVYNPWWGLELPYLIFTLPFAVWLVVACAAAQRQIPRATPAADRAAPARPGDRRAWVLRVVVAAACPSLLATGALAFIAAWNELLLALALVRDATQQAAPLSAAFAGRFGTLPAVPVLAGVAALALPALGRMWVQKRRAGAPAA